jgi:outer membrane protein TolC
MRWATDPTEQPSGTSDSDDVGKIGISLVMPVFEGGRIQAHLREEQAKLVAAQNRLRKLELQVRLEVETARTNIVSARERLRTTEKALEQARESLRIEQEKYELAKGAISDVLDAQSALLEAETNYHRALADFNIAQAQRSLAIGD